MTKTTKPPTVPTLKIERVFNASPERLWAFWTDPQKYAKWLNPAPGIDLVIHEFDVRPGGRVRFDMPQPNGDKNPQEGVFHSLDPYHEIVSGAPDKSFLIKVTFEPEGNKTRMVVEVTGVPPEFLDGAMTGWNAGFDKLARALEADASQGRPNPLGRGFTIERTFKAPVEKVWALWTTKAGLAKWFGPDPWVATVTELDLRVGGRYSIAMTDGKQTIVNHGHFAAIEPLRRLAQVWRFDIFLGPQDQPYDVPITVEFEAVPGGTKVTFVQGPLASDEYTEGSRQGVTTQLDHVAKVLGP
jgi:uncharacterized protein YndB with AHSA1/START domain